MKNILIVTSSIQSEGSASNRLIADFEARLRRDHPGARIVRRDVAGEPLPHLQAETVAAIRGEPASDAARRARALSDELVAELQAADLIVIGAPMYNFGIASTLKAWFDHVLRAGVTFRYTEAGPEGLLKGKQAVVVESRGGLYSEGPAAAMDSQEPHLRTLLSFIGIDRVEWVRAERLAFGPEAAAASLEAAAARLGVLAGTELALAA